MTVAEYPNALRGQPGPQLQFLSSPADVVLFGGGAGGGKTRALIMESLRYVGKAGYYGVIFRRNTTHIRAPGSIWEESRNIFSKLGATSREYNLEQRFPNGSVVRFAHMEHEKNRFDWHGAQLTFIGFDELQQFTKNQFWYLFSRARNMLPGVKPYIRATCNPDPDSFVADLVSWYIDQDTGYAIPERSGVIRYFTRVLDEDIVWGDSKEELCEKYPNLNPNEDIKSFTFIKSSVYDNKILLDANPSYLSDLKAQSYVDRERLLNGNWIIRPSAGTIHKAAWYEIVDAAPAGMRVVRWWDRAATEPSEKNSDPDYTATVAVGRTDDGMYYVLDAQQDRLTPLKVKNWIGTVASQDDENVEIVLACDPGQAGVSEVQDLIRSLAGYNVRSKRETGDKITRSKPISAQGEAGNIKIVRGRWNRLFLGHIENFPDGKHDDIADAFHGAMTVHMRRVRPRASWL